MKKLYFIAALMPILMAGCSKEDQTKNNGLSQNSSGIMSWLFADLANSITITNFEGEPLKGAQVLIGDAINNPFSGNFLTANELGQIELPGDWTQNASVTVAAPGYVRMTYLNQSPGPLVIKLHRNSSKKYQVGGKVTNLPVKDFDGIADFALVMPALTKSDLLSFDINSIISSQTDSFTTLGQTIAVPSNISLPTQKEKYSFFTATLDKPGYRSYLSQSGISRLYALRGNFAFSELVNDLRNGKSFFDVINKLNITGGSVRDINIKSDQTTLDLPGNELNFNDKRKAFAPTIKSDETFLAVGLAQQSGYLIPTDVKNLASGQGLDFALLPKSNPLFLGVIKKTQDLSAVTDANKDRMSATILNFSNDIKPSMLPLIDSPKLNGQGDLTLPAIKTISGVQRLMTYSVMSQIVETVQGNTKEKNLKRIWEVYAQDWVTNINVPQWPNDAALKGTKRWEVSFIGGQNTSQPGVGPAIIESATHVTHSSLDF